jgi:malate dehydrogenase (oxaloacetate-decarboxylating)(NADP+)
MQRAAELARYADPTLIVDGELQGDIAVNGKKLEAAFPFSSLKNGANVLIFPNLEASNIACRLLTSIGGAEKLGPILTGMAKPVHLLTRGVEVEEIVNITTVAVVDAQDVAFTPAARAAEAAAAVGV